MCCSFLGQILYGILMFTCLCLTLAGMFSPGWRELKDEADNTTHKMGLWPYACQLPSNSPATTPNPNGGDGKSFCKEWWKNLKPFEKAVITCMVLAVIAEIVALVWNLFTLCACCCKKYIIHPLSVLAFLVALFLGVAILIYGINNKNYIQDIKGDSWSGLNDNTTSAISYSFYITIGALVVAIADIVVGALTVALADHCL